MWSTLSLEMIGLASVLNLIFSSSIVKGTSGSPLGLSTCHLYLLPSFVRISIAAPLLLGVSFSISWSTFTSTFLASWSSLLLFILFILVAIFPVRVFAEYDQDEKEIGGHIEGIINGEKIILPTLKTDIEADVQGDIASVTVKQVFLNILGRLGCICIQACKVCRHTFKYLTSVFSSDRRARWRQVYMH